MERCVWLVRLEKMNNPKEFMFPGPNLGEKMNSSKEFMFSSTNRDEKMNNSKEFMFSGTGRARAPCDKR
jgi:hypothetical protein